MSNIGTMVKLKKPQDLQNVLEEVREDRKGNRDFQITDAKKFNVRSMGKDSPSGYGLEVKGQLMPFGMDGIKSLCSFLGMDFKYFNKYPNKEELIEHTNTLLPHKMLDQNGVLVRATGTGAVRAVLPGKYTILDDDQILEMVHNIGYQTLGKLQGIIIASDRWDNSIYRLCFGESLLKTDEVYSCVNIRNSEIGGPLNLGFGTLRVICTNGMMDQTKYGQILNWGHRGNFDSQVQKIGASLRQAEDWASPITAQIKLAQDTKVENPGTEISRLEKGGWINAEFAETAKGLLKEDLKFGSESGGATKYGVWNALTAGARGYRPKQRAKFEQVAHRYLMLKK